MESAPKSVAKNIEKPKYAFAGFNGLFKDSEIITEELSKGSEEILFADFNDVRAGHVETYNKFVSSTLGIDPSSQPEQDPFFKVAGIDFDSVYRKKHLLGDPKFMGGETAFSPSTLLFSGNYFLEMDERDAEYREGEDAVLAFQELEKTRVTYDFFDPVLLNQERGWELQFGFATFHKKEDARKKISQGAVVLEPGVLDLVSKSPEAAQIADSLKDVLTWFNHDLIAHGTFLPNHGIDLHSLQGNRRQDLVDSFFTDQDADKTRAFGSAHAGELWSLNFHESVFQKFVEERPAVLRYLRAHMDRYSRAVGSAAAAVPGKDLGKDCGDYLMKAYSFGFFRLVDPVIFNESPEFEHLRAKHPGLSDLGPKEDNVRGYVFGEQGLAKNLNDSSGFIPHSELFSSFAESLRKSPEYDASLALLIGKLRGGESVPAEDKGRLKGILRDMPDEAVKAFFSNVFNFGQKDSIGRFSAKEFVGNHLGQAIDCLLEDGVTRHNFQERLAKRVYGFLLPRIERQADKERGQREYYPYQKKEPIPEE